MFVFVTEVSIQKKEYKPYDADGCTQSGDKETKIYAVVKYALHNSGSDDFVAAAPNGFVGEASCHKPAIFKFLTLEGLIDGVTLSKYATCVVDDDLAGQDACSIASGATGMKIGAGKSYGRKNVVSVSFPIATGDFSNLKNYAADKILNLKLSVNPLISNGVAGEESVAKGSELTAQNWDSEDVLPTVVLFSAYTVKINALANPSDLYLNLAEVQLFHNNVQLPTYALNFILSSVYQGGGITTYSADKCNDGDLTTTFCNTGLDDSDPTLTITASEPFDKVVVYNRPDGQGSQRIQGATITTNMNGQSSSTLFPQSPNAVFTFLLTNSGLQYYSPPAPTHSPTPIGSSTIVITDLTGEKYINLGEVQLFNGATLLDRTALTFTLSSTYPGYPASLSNDGDLTNFCNSGLNDNNPSLTIISPTAFDSVKVYNRPDGAGTDRIKGAAIKLTVNGQTSTAYFPSSSSALYTFTVSSGTIQYST